MHIKIYLVFCTSFIYFYGVGQNMQEISGRVVDGNDLLPLIGAQVFGSPNTGTVTRSNGEFHLDLLAGTEFVTISYLGYEPRTVGINAGEKDLGTIQLEVSATSLDEIIVSASLQNFRNDFKGSNFRIGPKAIQNVNPINTEEALRKVPGINIVGDMGISNRPNISIRGSWGRRSEKILLMEDGSPTAPAPYIAPGAYYNPVSDRIQAIEVYKGADILRYGPNNMYGAVNYITALPPQSPELRLKLVGGQRNYSTGLFSYGGTWKNLGSLIEGVYKRFDGFTDNSSVEVLNLNAKIFARLSENQSLYFKISGQYEDNQASLSSITPYTFDTDPTQNPFDADIFTMRRYGLDIIHKWLPNSDIRLTTKLYATDFERDWWRQVTTKIKANEANEYLGDVIFNDRYSYLNDQSFGDDDIVRVGKLTNGRESTTDSRWTFTVSGIKENLELNWDAFGQQHVLEAGVKLHQEMYSDRFLTSDSSRWSRTGNFATDLKYRLWSASGYLRNELRLGSLAFIPIFRIEHIEMYRQDLIALSNDPGLSGLDEGKQINHYNVFLPGFTASYQLQSGEIYGSIYQGFIAPSKVFGFLLERDGVVTNPLAGEAINIQPELSTNMEIGWRGSTLSGKLDGQVTYFHNRIRNFYAGGRNEVFDNLGKIQVQGLELGLCYDIFRVGTKAFRIHTNIALLDSRVVAGTLVDRDLFDQVTHSDATKAEFIDKVNAQRPAYTIYTQDNEGNESILTDQHFSFEDFEKISKAGIRFGEEGILNTSVPYTPVVNLSTGLDFEMDELSSGFSAHYVGEQYTEFNNFENESADGAIGKLDEFLTIDAYLNYDFLLKGKSKVNVFVNGKNLTNRIYRASRLNRATSGIFPGGFRQLIFGMNIRI